MAKTFLPRFVLFYNSPPNKIPACSSPPRRTARGKSWPSSKLRNCWTPARKPWSWSSRQGSYPIWASWCRNTSSPTDERTEENYIGSFISNRLTVNYPIRRSVSGDFPDTLPDTSPDTHNRLTGKELSPFVSACQEICKKLLQKTL